jgi:ABC-2 type transport system permease protein
MVAVADAQRAAMEVARIARHECRIMWRDDRFRWIAGILALLLAVAGAVSAELGSRRSAAIAAAQQEQREQWLEKRVANAHVAAHAGITIFRPLHPLVVVDNGVDDVVGQALFLEPHRRSLPTNSAAERTSRATQFAELTVAFTFQTLVPLLIPSGSKGRSACSSASACAPQLSCSGRRLE